MAKRYLEFRRRMIREGITEKNQDVLMNCYEEIEYEKVRGR